MEFNQNLRCELRVSYRNYPGHLHFILFSDRDGAKVYESWNSWGYFARSFRVVDFASKTYEIKRRDGEWSKNGPTTKTINKGDFLIEDIYLCDGTWRISPPLPLPPPGGSPVIELQITGHFQNPPDKDAASAGVWTGQIESQPVKISVGKECVERLNSDRRQAPTWE